MNKLFFTEKFIEIKCDRDDTTSQYLAYQIPYIHMNRTKTSFKTSISNIAMVLKLFRNFELGVTKLPISVQALLDKELQRQSYTKALLELGPTGTHDWLWSHQVLGLELADANDKFGFFFDTRTGKTPMSLQIIANDVARNPQHKWLVLCPLILIENAWLEDARRMFPDLSVVNLHSVTRAKRLEKFKANANLYISNIESFISYKEEIESLGVYGCFVDESSTMKSAKSEFGKAAVEFANTLKRWYILSGTPAPNGEWEYYRQLQSIDYYGVHESYSQFVKYFFNDVSRNPQYQRLEIKLEKKAELMELLRKYTIYVDKEDVLVTPGRTFNVVEFEMPKDLAAHYKKFKDELYIELGEDVSITAPSTAAKLNKLNQISSGFIIDTEAVKFNKGLQPDEIAKQESYLLSMFRFEALYSLIDTIPGEQVIIWANYHKEFEILRDHFRDKCRCINGEVSITEKNENIKAFKEKRVQYLIANPASADKGLTLTNAHYCIYFSMNYSYELFKQSMERIYGSVQSQPKHCLYYILEAKGTVDKVIYDTVSIKGNMSKAILDHLKVGM